MVEAGNVAVPVIQKKLAAVAVLRRLYIPITDCVGRIGGEGTSSLVDTRAQRFKLLRRNAVVVDNLVPERICT